MTFRHTRLSMNPDRGQPTPGVQLDLFNGELAPVAIPRRRPVGHRAGRGVPQYHQVLPGHWAVVHYALSPKQGWPEAWEFPMFWCERGRWCAPFVDGDVAEGTLAWATRADAQADLEANYPPGDPFCPSWLDFPSFDQRRRPHP